MVRTKLICASDSHPGLARKNNEDRVYADPERGIFLVVDGVGGHAAGERAAGIAEMRIRRRLERLTGTAEERVREAITVANNEIVEVAAKNPDWHGMACVLTLALIEDGAATIGHVGDSRLYKIHGNEIRKLTHDHSPVGEREDAGELSESEAMAHPRRNEVYRDVGSQEHTPDDPDFIEVRRVPFEPDCALLLCSDGLSDQVPSAEVLRVVQQHAAHPQSAVRDLIEAANLAGGKDNVSVLIVEGEEFAAAAAAVTAPPVKPNPMTGRWAFLGYGVMLAIALMAIAAWQWSWMLRPPDPPKPPAVQVLAVGPKAQYKTIGEAMAKAAPGDTVEVAGGEYREAVQLKNGVTLRSTVPREAILRAAPVELAPMGVAVLSQFVRGARIVGFRILADAKLPLAAGIVLDGGDVEVEDMEVAGCKVGVRIQGSQAVLRANAIHDNVAEGITIDPQAAVWLSHNAIVNNGRDANAPHVDVSAALAQPTLIGNVFTREQSLRLPSTFSRDTLRQFNFFIGEPARPARGGRKR